MIYLGIFLGILIMSAMIYMAVDKKSSPAVRLVCLIALGVMVLTVIICLFIIFTDNRVPVDESVLIVGAPVEIKSDSGANIWILLLLVIILLGLFVMIAFFTMRENRKNKLKNADNKKNIFGSFKL